MKKIKQSIFIFLIAAISLNTFAKTTYNLEPSENELIIQGEGTVKVIADVAEVRLAVELKDTDLKKLRTEISDKSKKIIKNLKSNKAKKVETEQLSIYPNYDRNNRQQITGYTGRINIIFETNALDAGKLINVGFDAGANKIDGIYIKPNDSVLAKAKKKSLVIATKDALNKAEHLFSSVGLLQKHITKINTVTSPVYPYHREAGFAMNALKSVMSDVAPEITAKEREVRSEVTVSIAFEE